MAVDRDFEMELHAAMQPAPAGSLFETFADKARRRVDQVIGGTDCKWMPTEQQRNLLIRLRNHQGRHRAVPLLEISRRMQLPERGVKELVRDLRLNFGVLLCSSRTGDGYWIAETMDDVDETVKPYYAQALSELRLIFTMRRNAESMDQFLTQLALDLEAEEDRRG
jgi:hypothetical protein